MYRIKRQTKFAKDMIRMTKRGQNMELLKQVIFRIVTANLIPRDKDHPLKGNFRGYRECHVKGDWVVVYRKLDEQTIELYRTGSHSDIFKQKY